MDELTLHDACKKAGIALPFGSGENSLKATYMKLYDAGIHHNGVMTPTWIKYMPEDVVLLHMAHRDKKPVMNKMVDTKYNCGDLY